MADNWKEKVVVVGGGFNKALLIWVNIAFYAALSFPGTFVKVSDSSGTALYCRLFMIFVQESVLLFAWVAFDEPFFCKRENKKLLLPCGTSVKVPFIRL